MKEITTNYLYMIHRNSDDEPIFDKPIDHVRLMSSRRLLEFKKDKLIKFCNASLKKQQISNQYFTIKKVTT